MESNDIINDYYFDEMIKIEDFDLDILTDEKSYKNILFYNISCKNVTAAKRLRVRLDKIDDLLGFMMELDS